ncbi:MAG: hypothetical protein Q9220_005818 [cf. Caloplaca sp. 1 TL-2023]
MQPNQAHGHGPPAASMPGSMPPPPGIPDTPFHRQNQAYASAPRAPADRWPLGVTDDQRQLQEQYRQQQSQTPQIHHHPGYPQASPISSVSPAGPVSSFPPPSQTRTPPHVPPPPESPRVAQNPSKAASTPQATPQPMTVSTAKPTPPSAPAVPTPGVGPGKSSPPSTSLESQRVTALLDLNRILLQEVVALQTENKTAPPAAPTAQQTSPTPATSDPSTTTTNPPQQQTKPDPNEPTTDSSPAKDATAPPSNNSNNTTNKLPQQPPPSKIIASKEYIEYMRRLQANLAYLASVADRHHKPGNAVPQFPAIMEPPSSVTAPPLPTTNNSSGGGGGGGGSNSNAKDGAEAEEGGSTGREGREHMRQLYTRLRELWPEYKGKAASVQGTNGPPAAVGAPAVTTAAAATTAA